jgi:outer membrane protein
MLTFYARKMIRVLALCAVLCASSVFVFAQTPSPSPTPPFSPTQREATRPPGSEQNPPSPTAPPGAQQTSPTAPPGTNAPTTQNPQQNANPPAANQEPREPSMPPVQPKPLPPMPNLTRLGVTSDNALTLSLNDAIKRALANNNDIEVARDDVRYAETQLRSLEGVYQPVFSITPQIDKRITPQTSIFSGAVGGTTTSTVYSLSPSINKSFATGGGNYQLSFSNTKTITSATSSTLNPFYSSNLALSFAQPLLRNRSIDSNRHAIRVQKKRLEQSDADFRRKTIDVISQVQSAYWDLVFALRDQQIQTENLNLSRENLKRVEAQIAAGAAAPLARAEVQTELANRESTLLVAVQAVSIAENNLKQLILKDSTAPEWMAALTPTDTPSFDSTPVNLNDAIAEARKNRPELHRLRSQRDINGLDLQFFRNQAKPQVDLQATLATTGLAGTPCDPVTNNRCSPPPTNLVGGYGQDLSNLAGLSTRNITIGVAIQIPLRNKTAQANLAGAQIQKEQLEASVRSTELLVEVDVRNAAQSVETSRRRVLTAREARANAELQLEGEQRLYSVGRSTTFLLFQRENALANARDAELRAETDYNKALAALQHATSTTLHANNVIVESRTAP